MKNKASLSLSFRYTALLLLAISIFSAQLATLQHGIHHPFHEHTDLCDSFLSFEHHAAAVDVFVLPASVALEQQAFLQAVYFYSSQQYSYYAIRGPPVSLK